MAIYDHVCTDEKCAWEWEDSYSIMKDPPTQCPKCLQETAKRLISLNARGVVELIGNDLKEKVMGDAEALKRKLRTDENLYANMLSENKYQKLQSNYDKNKR
jgi:putative FmdB family regulatory protein